MELNFRWLLVDGSVKGAKGWPLLPVHTEKLNNTTISPALFQAVTVTVVKDRRIRTPLRANQIAGLVTVPPWERINNDIYWSNSSLQKRFIDFLHQLKKSRVEKLKVRFSSIVQLFLWVWLGLIAELNRTQSMNWVRLSAIGFDWLCWVILPQRWENEVDLPWFF